MSEKNPDLLGAEAALARAAQAARATTGQFNLPKLKQIGGDLNASGAKGLQIPALESVGGDFIVSGTGLAHLPIGLQHIGGDAVISPNEPITLLNELNAAKQAGILKGKIFVR